IINKLKKEIPFTTNSIGNKWNISERLKQAKEFSSYLIPTEIVKNMEGFHKFISSFHRVVFKPIDGRKGKGIYFISKVGESYVVRKDVEDQTYTKERLNNLLEGRLSAGTFIVQPYINSTTKSGQVFDFR